MIVTFDDVSVMPLVKKAITLMHGVKSVSIPKKKKLSPIEKSLQEIEHGEIHHAKDVDDMFKQILGPDYVLC
ncbi:MAG: hypothetical protein Q4F34_01075 [Prevotellaceae bacterium]|nr:hypothetical protein [Prevotellaceae bacterium]